MEQTFKEIVARYCETKPEDMDPEKRFREDLGFSSLDFMSLLGELEDTFEALNEYKIPGFRRLISDRITGTGEMSKGNAFRPAEVYRKA